MCANPSTVLFYLYKIKIKICVILKIKRPPDQTIIQRILNFLPLGLFLKSVKPKNLRNCKFDTRKKVLLEETFCVQ